MSEIIEGRFLYLTVEYIDRTGYESVFSPRTRRVKCLFPQTLTQERWNGREGVEARRPLLVSLLVFEVKAASNLKTSLSDQHPHWIEHASQHFRCRNLYTKLRSRSAARYVVAMLQFYLLIVFLSARECYVKTDVSYRICTIQAIQ